jgi:hypothetical protein
MSWMFPFRFDQVVAPNTTWFPTVINYQGDPVIERRITEEVASFGKQLGIISEALLEISDRSGQKQIDRLRRIVSDINELKARQHVSLTEATRDSFEALVRDDPDRARVLADDLVHMAKTAQRKRR